MLSAGGRLFELASEGVEVTVFTVFAGRPMPPFSPVAAYLHGLWGLGDAPVVHRQAEDRLAMSLLGVAERHGSFLDAVYRRTTDGEGWLIGMDGVPPRASTNPNWPPGWPTRSPTWSVNSGPTPSSPARRSGAPGSPAHP